MTYVDGIIIPVPKKKFAAYRAMSKKFGKVCRKHGATRPTALWPKMNRLDFSGRPSIAAVF